MRERVPLILVTLVLTTILAPVLISSVRAPCTSTCLFETNTNLPASEGSVTVRLDGSSFQTLNRTFSFAFNSSHTIEVMNTTFYSTSGARYVFKEWTYNGQQWSSTPTLSGPPFPVVANYITGENHPFVAEFKKEFQASLSFTDPNGQDITPPSSVTIQGTSIITLTSYTNLWLDSALWTVTEARWQSTDGIVYGSPTIDLRAGPFYGPIPLNAYPATVKVVDGSNNPVSGATLQVTLYNQTNVSLTTDSQGMADLGHIPFGSYTLNVSYQNQNYGPFTGNASTEPVKTVTLTQPGGTSPPIVSALVLLTIFGVAVFLLLLAVRVRRAAPPPSI